VSRILLTGMSGTGKSTVLKALESDDTICVELDDGFWLTGSPIRIRTNELLDWMSRQSALNIVIAGCEENQGEMYKSLDAVIVMTAPDEVMRKRILARPNPFGKSADEWEKILSDKREFEPLLKAHCTYVCDTNRPFDEVLEDIRRFIE